MKEQKKTKVIASVIILLAAIALLTGRGMYNDIDSPAETKTTQTDEGYRFRNKKLLDEHYRKHGIDMGFKSAEEYETAASAAVVNPNALHKVEKEDGDDVYYITATNEFVIVSTDGYIRTYFKPDSGIKYFKKQ